MFPKRLIAAFILATLFTLALVACGQEPTPEVDGEASIAPSVSKVPAAAEVSDGSTSLLPARVGRAQPVAVPAPTPSASAAAPASLSPTVEPERAARTGELVEVVIEKEVPAEAVVEPSAESSHAAAVTSEQADAWTPPPAMSKAISPQATAAPAVAFRSSGGGSLQPATPPTTTFRDYRRNPAVAATEDAVSTFSMDTDRTSYRLALSWARAGYAVEPDSVRAEEWINAFNYDYARPAGDAEFAIATDVFRHPLDEGKHLACIAFQAPDVGDDSTPLNVTLVLDASGSMAEGDRVEIARAAAESIRQSLRPQDRIAVVLFSEDVLAEAAHSPPNQGRAQEVIEELAPNGATNVQAGLNRGVQLADEARRHRPAAYNYVILMSDGVANVDATNPFAILETAHDADGANPLRLITIGVGIANYNDYLLEQLAQHGNGWYRYLDDTGAARATFSRENWLALAMPFADQARAQVTWNQDLVRSWRIVGYENRVTADENFAQNRKEFAEIPSGAATTVFYELELTDRVAQRPADTAKLGDVELRWVEPSTGRSREQYAAVAGRWRDSFDALKDPLLQLGTVVALSADRYSALPQAGYNDYPSDHSNGYSNDYSNVGQELAALQERLELLRHDLGHLDAYADFSLLLARLTQDAPPAMTRPRDSGYSP